MSEGVSLQVCVVAEGTSLPREECGGLVKCPVMYPMRERREEKKRGGGGGGGGKFEDKVCLLHPYIVTPTHFHSHTPNLHTPTSSEGGSCSGVARSMVMVPSTSWSVGGSHWLFRVITW